MKDVTSIFPERLKELRGEKTKMEVAEGIGISRVALGYYESGERKPDYEVLAKIADYYNVSTDYLIGITEVKNPDVEIRAFATRTGLSEKSIDTLLELNTELLKDLLIPLNFLLEDILPDGRFGVALALLNDYQNFYQRQREKGRDLYELVHGEDNTSPQIGKTAMEYYGISEIGDARIYRIYKLLEEVVDQWVEAEQNRLDNLSPEEG